ncbi:helix-turn-helix domain-containing protein [Companilactobacillus sp. DQM5]|uniref:helix-turn-helix domain-containing protein n=1 Tax=Companilactobacillus sp. DQM5 TaxID=3463359 RepID=UPI00405A08FD
MDELLNEDDQYKILLLTIFNLFDNSELTVAYFLEYFGISRYKFNQILDGILFEQEEDRKVFLSLKISINDDIVKWFSVTNDYIQYKRYQYINKSEKFELFQYISLYNKNISEFIEEKHVSRTKAYKITHELNEILKNFNISLGASKFKGRETDIRNFMYQVFYSFFSEKNVPFDDETKEYIEMVIYGINMVIRANKKHIPFTQIQKLSFFIGVNHIRIKNNYLIDKSKKISDVGRIEINRVFGELHKIINTDYIDSNDKLINEKKFFYEFIRLNITPQLLMRISENQDIDITRISNDFLEVLKKNKLLPGNNVKKLYQNITLIHERLKEFPWIPVTFNMKQQSKYFEENYFAFHNIIVDFLNNNEFYTKNNLNSLTLNGVYYDLMFSLIDAIPLDILQRKVYVYVDFSRGDLYTKYISKNIESYRELNVVIQEELNQYTDILVSDVQIDNVKCKKIIWKNPPSATDWKEFADAVLDLKKEV